MIAYSIIIPVYNEEDNLVLLQDELLSVLVNLPGSYEVIYVDDGSTDRSFEALERLYAANQNVKVIKFRTNYGKSAALAAGLRWARGDIIITLDADLQDDPHEIPRLIEKLSKGYDMVCGWRYSRRDPLVKRLSSKAFNMAIRILTGIKLHDINCGLKVFKREVTAALHIYGELHRLIPVLAFWNGFEVAELEVHHRQRKFNRSKFGIERFPGAFFDLLAARFKTRYAYKPLHLLGAVGLLLGFAGLIASIGSIVFWLRGSDIRNYYPLIVFAALLVMTGVQFLLVGILGEMIASAAQKEDQQYLIHKTLE
jgi:glycosyltransferase involved in cell wall biosynthesis